ncbi:hypothetical protein PILCRDRAFT_821432, partial [Piloderma croceum F 1598]
FQEQLGKKDKDLPTGLISGLEQLRKKLELIPHNPFSKADALAFLQVKIKTAPLLLSLDVMSDIRNLGSFLWILIELVKCHVSLAAEAGCRILINMILLRVVSAMSTDKMDIKIIPEFPIAKTTFSGSRSLLPSRYTRYLLLDPTSALGNSETIDGPTTSNFFEAKRDNVRAIPQAVMAEVSHCAQHGCEQWMSFVYATNENGGGRVACSDEFSPGEQLEGRPLILGLLTYYGLDTSISE